MKFFGLTLGLAALVSADFSDVVGDALEDCLIAKCPTEYANCKKKAGCEDILFKCRDKCGEKVDQTCWTNCLLGKPLIITTTSAVANCAVKVGCISNSEYNLQ